MVVCSLTRITYLNSVLDHFFVLFLWDFEKLFCTIHILQGQGAITEKLRSLSMHDLTQINQQDDRRGNQFFHFSSHSASPAVRRSQNVDSAAEDGTSVNTQTQILRYTHTSRFLALLITNATVPDFKILFFEITSLLTSASTSD